MKNRPLSKLTRTYVLALSLIALLALATFITMHQVILTQADIFRPLANTLLEERSRLEHANQELSFLSLS
jgi:hypothetical protein